MQLLYRTTRRLHPERGGRRSSIRGAKNVKAAALDASSMRWRGFGEKVSGHVRMSVPTISGELLLADAVADFVQQHPGLTVEMSLDTRFVNLVEEGFDLGHSHQVISIAPASSPAISSTPSAAVSAAPAYVHQELRARASPQTCRLTTACATPTRARGVGVGLQGGGRRLSGVGVGELFNRQRRCPAQGGAGGRGIVYVPRCLVYHDLMSGNLVDLFPERVGKKLGIYAVYPFTRQPPRKIRLLIEHIRQRYLDIAHYFV